MQHIFVLNNDAKNTLFNKTYDNCVIDKVINILITFTALRNDTFDSVANLKGRFPQEYGKYRLARQYTLPGEERLRFRSAKEF